MRSINLQSKALNYLKEKGIEAITVDVDTAGAGCLPISHAIVLEERPERTDAYERYDVEGIEIYVFSPMDFSGDKVTISFSGGFFGKKGLQAKELNLL